MPSTTKRETEELEDLARRALAEDLGQGGDLTSKRIVRAELPCRARLLAKSPGVLAGTAVAPPGVPLVGPPPAVRWELPHGDAPGAGAAPAGVTRRGRAGPPRGRGARQLPPR